MTEQLNLWRSGCFGDCYGVVHASDDDVDDGDTAVHHARVELELGHLLCRGSIHGGLGGETVKYIIR